LFYKKIFLFKDHHVPLNDQQQQNIESANEQETQNQCPLTPNNNPNRFDTNVWVNFRQKKKFIFNLIFLAYTTIR
jgi:hypothetical protein